MEWLAVRFKEDWFLYVQHRLERENNNSVHIDIRKVINTIVVKKFNTQPEAVKYCADINQISEMLNKI